MAIIQIKNLHKAYPMGLNDLTVLDDFNLQVNQGEYIAIMGPSGSGKSTLLNILGCLDRPSGGTYCLNDQDVTQLSDDQLSRIRGMLIGFIFQSYNLIAQLNVVENIEIPMFYQGVGEKEGHQRAIELAQRVGLGDRLQHRPSELSGGQQQRVAIARALANDPPFILADEPTGNLDSQSGREILLILDELHQMGKTLMVITHNETIAERAQKIIHLLDGRIDRVVENGKN
jgi:putative ABC transport system ATP-binding protein